jgi:hypothetical protein
MLPLVSLPHVLFSLTSRQQQFPLLNDDTACVGSRPIERYLGLELRTAIGGIVASNCTVVKSFFFFFFLFFFFGQTFASLALVLVLESFQHTLPSGFEDWSHRFE